MTVVVLVYVGGWEGHEGVRLLIFPLAVHEPCVFYSSVASRPGLWKSQTQSVHPDVDRCATLDGTTSAATRNKRRKHTGGRATLGLSCSPPLETVFLGSLKTLGKHCSSFQEAAGAPRCGPLRCCRCSINNLNTQQSLLIQMWGVMSWKDTQRVAVAERGGGVGQLEF